MYTRDSVEAKGTNHLVSQTPTTSIASYLYIYLPLRLTNLFFMHSYLSNRNAEARLKYNLANYDLRDYHKAVSGGYSTYKINLYLLHSTGINYNRQNLVDEILKSIGDRETFSINLNEELDYHSNKHLVDRNRIAQLIVTIPLFGTIE